MAVPVTFVCTGGSVVFRVSPYSQLAQYLPDAQAALEVDDIDYFTRSGWSVVLRGEIRVVPLTDDPLGRPVRSIHAGSTPRRAH